MLDGRRLWFVGIGGAGLSAYALLARAWGAEVGGWDRNETPYLVHVRAAGIPVAVSPEPEAPDGWEAVVSSAYPSFPGTRRAELLAELVSLRRSIVVAGAHGKTTTTGMIAFALAETGRDPAMLVGAELPQLGGNARAGEGWLVVEGDESDRTVERLRPEIAVVTNIELDHHATFASEAEVEELFERWAAQVPHVVRGWELEPVEFPLAVPGAHNRRERRRRARRARAGRRPAGRGGARRSRASAARRGGSSSPARPVACGSTTTTRTTRPSSRASIAAARELGPARVLVLFQPHLPSRTRHLAHELGARARRGGRRLRHRGVRGARGAVGERALGRGRALGGPSGDDDRLGARR